jgi:hypothetical protein
MKVIQRAIATSCGGFLCWIVPALFLPCPAARADLQFDVFVGYDQILPEHSWFPVTCELHNDGPSFNAEIQVTAGDWGGGQIRRFPIDLPTQTRKRVVIPVFAGAPMWHVRLVDGRGIVRAEQSASNIKVIGNHLPLVAGLARTVGGMPVFPETANGQPESKFVAARLQSALFPDNPLALEGIDMLYLSSEKAADLSIGQVNALVAWLQDGGHLVVGVEQVSDIGGTPWLRELLPCDLTTTVNLAAHDSLQAWVRTKVLSTPLPPVRSINPGYQPRRMYTNQGALPRGPRGRLPRAGPPPGSPRMPPVSNSAPVINPSTDLPEDAEFDAAPLQVATGTPRDGTILIGDSAAPLAFEGKRGRGRITALGFSPEREPFLSWKNRPWFWARLAEVPAGAFQSQNQYRGMARMSSDAIFGAMIDSRQIRKLPLGWLLALLAAYLVVIGPLDQYWLRKINRQMLTWITFPFYVLVFSGLIYWIGFHLRAGELEWNELNLVDVLPDNGRAVLRGQTYVSIYSPVNAHYELAGEEPFATLRGEAVGNFGGGLEGSRVSVTQHGNNFEADAFVPVWTSQLYVSDWLQPAPLPLTMTATRQASGWQVTVENKMDHKLAGARIVLEGRIYNLGELPAGQSKTFALNLAAGQLLGDWAQKSGPSFRDAAAARRNSFGNNNAGITDLAASSMAASFLSQANESANNWQTFSSPGDLDLSRYAAPGYGILLAWDPDHALTAALNRFPVKRSHRNTLLRLVVPLTL